MRKTTFYIRNKDDAERACAAILKDPLARWGVLFEDRSFSFVVEEFKSPHIVPYWKYEEKENGVAERKHIRRMKKLCKLIKRLARSRP